MRILIGFILAFSMLLTQQPCLAAPNSSPVVWQKYADDLDIADFLVTPSALASAHITFFRSTLSRFRVAALRATEFGNVRATVKSLCRKSKAALCINANFFDENGEALGLVINGGITYHKIHRGGSALTGVFQSTRTGLQIINRGEFQHGPILEAIQAGPRLLAGGKPVQGLRDSGSTARTGVCIDAEKRILFFIVPSALVGISIQDLQLILKRREIDCVDALNLDGGGSAQLFVNTNLPGSLSSSTEISYTGSDEVPVALALFMKP